MMMNDCEWEYCNKITGEFREAANLADQILEIAPHHERIKVNKENYERYIKEEPIKRNDRYMRLRN